MANDLILGYAFGWTLRSKSLQIADWITYWILKTTNEWVVQILAWLGDWPAGLKLNTELALFFGDMYQGMTDIWVKEGLSRILPNLPQLIHSVGRAGQVLGMTMTISLVIDALNLFTLHLTGFYSIGRAVYVFFLYVLDSLFNLFRGKKRNPLRAGRIDDASYELDQLLLGTIFFVLLTFLFPTVFVYYLTFALYRLATAVLRTGLETALAFLNRLPLFALMLRLKDPHRLPFGIELRSIDSELSRASHQAPLDRITKENRVKNEVVDSQEERDVKDFQKPRKSEPHFSSGSVPVSVYEVINVPLHFPSLFAGVEGFATIPKLVFRILSGSFF